MKTCQYLGCSKPVPNTRRKYCCDNHCLYAGLKAYRDRQRAPLLAAPKTCKKCGNVFHNNETLAIKRCPDCRPKPPVIDRTCSECGRAFKYSKNGLTKVCSKRCVKDRHNRFAREYSAKVYTHVGTGFCQNCGGVITDKSWKFCRQECIDAFRKKLGPV